MSQTELETHTKAEDISIFLEALQNLTHDYAQKLQEFSDFSDKIDKTRYFNRQIDVNNKFISDVAQLNDELAFYEDKLLNLSNKLLDKDVIWIKNEHKVQPKNIDAIPEFISHINEYRINRFWDCIALSNYLYKTNEELYKQFDEYVKSLKIPYRGETARTDDINEYSYTEENKTPLDYWIEFE